MFVPPTRTVDDGALEIGAADLVHLDGDEAVVDVDEPANLHHLGQVLVVGIQLLGCALLLRGGDGRGCQHTSEENFTPPSPLLLQTLKSSLVVMVIFAPFSSSMTRRGSLSEPSSRPVRISGPLVSRAMAIGRPNWLAASRALAMVSAWYCGEGLFQV